MSKGDERRGDAAHFSVEKRVASPFLAVLFSCALALVGLGSGWRTRRAATVLFAGVALVYGLGCDGSARRLTGVGDANRADLRAQSNSAMSPDETMTPPSSPELSIVLVTTSVANIRKVLRCYRVQGDPARLEIVVVALAGTTISPDPIVSLGFPHVRTLAVASNDIGRAEEQAVHAATAPFVVFAQAHAYPRAGFVDAILARARSGRWTVVGPAMANANPRSLVSRAAMSIHYGSWSDRSPRGPAASVPGHHSAYDRRALLALGDELSRRLDAGSALQEALRARGGALFLEPAACVEIVNISRLWSYLDDQFLQSIKFARMRRRGWSTARRLLYVAGAPLIPAVRLVRILADLRRDGRLHEVWRALPVLLAGLTLSATGECLGYAADVAPRRADTALARLRYVRPTDRQHEMDESTWPA